MEQANSGGEKGSILLFQSPDGGICLDVKLERETVWLTLNQIATLFGRDKSVISRHLKNIYSSGELDRKASVAKNATVHQEGTREIERTIEFYDLDAVLSVGYRVNSLRGTQFRIWATRTLKDHLIRGYSLNEQRLRQQGVEMRQMVELLSRTLTNHTLVTGEGRAVLDVIHQYARVWGLLLAYDEDRLSERPSRPVLPEASLSLESAREAIIRLREDLADRNEATALFGNERGDSLAGILAAIEQTFGGERLYPNVQMRAAHLLYFIIKDHPFSDGNKRIGTFLFLTYLDQNGLLRRTDGSVRIADNAMVALALLVAESDPAQKDLMIRLIVNLLDEPRPSERNTENPSASGSP